MGTFESELTALINRYGKEDGSNTPDWLLSNYLADCLENYNKIVTARDKYYDFNPWDKITGGNEI